MTDFDYANFVGTPQSDEETTSNDLDLILDEGSIFDGVDLDSLPTNPFAIPDGTYKFRITGVKFSVTNATKDQDIKKVGVTFSYVVAEGDYEGRETTEWLYYPQKNDTEGPSKRVAGISNMRNHLEAYGIEQSDLTSFNHKTANDMVVGNEFYATVRVKKSNKPGDRDFTNFSDHRSLTGSTDDFDPFGSNDGPGF
jgi:hypothetical protein